MGRRIAGVGSLVSLMMSFEKKVFFVRKKLDWLKLGANISYVSSSSFLSF